MRLIVRTGACSRCGYCCCDDGDGNWQFKNRMDFCQFLRDDGDRIFTCMLRERLDAGATIEQMEAWYHPGIVEELQRHGCDPEDDFPQPEHFGWWEDTAEKTYGRGREQHLQDVLGKFNAWKNLSDCGFSFEIRNMKTFTVDAWLEE